MLRRSTIAVSNGLAVGLLVIGVGRIVAYVHPGGTVWSAVAVIAGIAAVLGFGLAERARSDDPQLGARRLGSVQLLAGVAVVLVLGGLYLLPVFRSVAVAQWADIVGPVCALLFFPMLLISTGSGCRLPRVEGRCCCPSLRLPVSLGVGRSSVLLKPCSLRLGPLPWRPFYFMPRA